MVRGSNGRRGWARAVLSVSKTAEQELGKNEVVPVRRDQKSFGKSNRQGTGAHEALRENHERKMTGKKHAENGAVEESCVNANR